jgi:CRP-like cAMP-binding protein
MVADISVLYWVWGPDFLAYGPVELPSLHRWILSGHVCAETPVYVGASKQWIPAGNVEELRSIFARTSSPANPGTTEGNVSAQIGEFRRMRLLADLSDQELEVFSKFCVQRQCRTFEIVVNKGDPGGAMYFILSGELRAFDTNGDKQVDLCTMGIGDSFGEISLLDHGERSASVQATVPSELLVFSGEAFQRFRVAHPDIAGKFLFAFARAAALRMRRLTRQFVDSMNLWRS